MAHPDPRRQREARKRLEDFATYPSNLWSVHYACQSFAQGQRLGSPRVTAIAARNVGSGETLSVSIEAEAEIAKLGPVQMLSRLDSLERAQLDKFAEFMTVNRGMRFVHWNMRDATFGFAAIEHRHQVLGGRPVTLPELQKLDLAKLLVDVYGSGYAGEVPLEGLAELNGIPLKGFLRGKDEAEQFECGNYRAVQHSTIAKAKLIADFAELARARTLKTNANWWALNFGRLREAVEQFDHNPVYAWSSLLLAGMSFGFGLVWRAF